MTKQELFNKADQYKKIIQTARPLKPEAIKEYEGIDKQTAGKYREIAVYLTGTDYLPPEPEQVPQLMKEYVTKVNQ